MKTVLLALLVVASGCTNPGAQINLRTIEQRELFAQKFGRAYVGKDAAGEWDVILIQDGLDEMRRRQRSPAGGPLQPTDIAPLREVVHLHVYWRPYHSNRRSNPAAINSAVDWYVLGRGSEADDFALYQGAGFVVFSAERKLYTIELRDAQIKPTVRRGNLSDPIGAATLSGTIYAQRDDARVREMIRNLQQRASPATTQALQVAP